jgi:uncharacterized protein with NRDE domain
MTLSDPQAYERFRRGARAASVIRSGPETANIYIERFYAAEPSMHKLKLGESQSEPFLSWNGLHRFEGVWGTWSGLAPDGSVLAVRDASSHEIYAIDLQLP